MRFDALLAATRAQEPSGDLAGPLLALWHDARGQWDAAHRVVQDLDTAEAAWVHAYLHRKEGDQGNAGYWYRRCRIAPFTGSLEQEWQELVAQLLRDAA